MQRAVCLLAIALVSPIVLPQAAAAQRREPSVRSRLLARAVPEVGLRAGYEFDIGGLGIGAQGRVPVGPFGELVLGGDYYLVSDQTAWQMNLDIALRVGFQQVLYGGAGLAIARRAFELDDVPQFPEKTKAGINLFAGLATPRFRRVRLRPYAEARWTFVSDFDAHFAVAVGVNMALAGGERRRVRAGDP